MGRSPWGSSKAFTDLGRFKIHDPTTGCILWREDGPRSYLDKEAQHEPMPCPAVTWRGEITAAWRVEWFRNTGAAPKKGQAPIRTCGTPGCLNTAHISMTGIRGGLLSKIANLVVGPTTDDPDDPDYYLNWGVDGPGHVVWTGTFATPPGSKRNPLPMVSWSGRSFSVRNILYQVVEYRKTLPKGLSAGQIEDYIMTRAANNGGEDIRMVPRGYITQPGCGEYKCVAPSHTVIGKAGGNSTWLGTRGRRFPAMQCKNGHQLTPENTYIGSHGARTCRQCRLNYLKNRRNTLGYLDPGFLTGEALPEAVVLSEGDAEVEKAIRDEFQPIEMLDGEEEWTS